MSRNPDPAGERLVLPRGYEYSESHRMLEWKPVRSRLVAAKNYWLATSGYEGAPHVTPVWGTWVDDAFYFTGIPTAKWARNIVRNPRASIHLESGDEVVIVDGVVEDLPAIAEPGIADQIVQSWTEKYGKLVPDPAGDGMYCLRPSRARAWMQFPDDLTRFVF